MHLITPHGILSSALNEINCENSKSHDSTYQTRLSFSDFDCLNITEKLKSGLCLLFSWYIAYKINHTLYHFSFFPEQPQKLHRRRPEYSRAWGKYLKRRHKLISSEMSTEVARIGLKDLKNPENPTFFILNIDLKSFLIGERMRVPGGILEVPFGCWFHLILALEMTHKTMQNLFSCYDTDQLLSKSWF